MRRRLLAAALAAALVAAGCGAAATSSPTGDSSTSGQSSSAGGSSSSGDAAGSGLVSIGAGLKGPAVLKATIYATGLAKMSAFAFDRKGRLWVATSAASGHQNDGVYLVREAGATPVKVIAGLKAPLGLLWDGGKLYVSSIGRVDAFSGLRGSRFANRERILDGPLADAFNNNLVRAPNGRLVTSVSARCDHCKPAAKWSAAVVSFRPDGSDLRLYATHIRAAFGLAYFPGTRDLFVTMNQRDDLGARTPGDWLAVVRQGQDWGFPDCYGQGGTVCSGVPKPTAVLDKHAAAGGVAIVTGQLGATVGTTAIVAEWQAGKVLRVALTRSGSTYKGSVAPFLTGLKNPLPVATTSDGALLVGDWTTGKIYRVTKA